MTDLEFQFLDFIQSHLRNGTADFIMKSISLSGTAGAVWFLAAALMMLKKSFRKDAVLLCCSVILGAVLCGVLIKPLAARPRPCDINQAVQLIVSRPSGWSFPSGHSTAAFAAASLLFFRKNRLWLLMMVFAAVMAFSRMYLYVHFPTDVLAGCALGFICGWTIYKLGD